MVAEISTHALREEGDFCESVAELLMQISTHALREEGDLCVFRDCAYIQCISTHALREEGDMGNFDGCAFAYCDFYPRPPRGGRPGRRAR